MSIRVFGALLDPRRAAWKPFHIIPLSQPHGGRHCVGIGQAHSGGNFDSTEGLTENCSALAWERPSFYGEL